MEIAGSSVPPWQPSIVVFFYTRCDNPMKCSLSVTKLARVHCSTRKIRAHPPAAITHDPEFDRAKLLPVYCKDRAVHMD
jgi:protein SCO1/2